MSYDTGGDVANILASVSADMAKDGVKITGHLAKEILLLLLNNAKEKQKYKTGEINLEKLLKSGEELKATRVNSEFVKEFSERAKELGIAFAVIGKKEDEYKKIIFKSTDEEFIKLTYEETIKNHVHEQEHEQNQMLEKENLNEKESNNISEQLQKMNDVIDPIEVNKNFDELLESIQDKGSHCIVDKNNPKNYIQINKVIDEHKNAFYEANVYKDDKKVAHIDSDELKNTTFSEAIKNEITIDDPLVTNNIDFEKFRAESSKNITIELKGVEIKKVSSISDLLKSNGINNTLELTDLITQEKDGESFYTGKVDVNFTCKNSEKAKASEIINEYKDKELSEIKADIKEDINKNKDSKESVKGKLKEINDKKQQAKSENTEKKTKTKNKSKNKSKER